MEDNPEYRTGKCTGTKDQHFAEFMNTHLRITKMILNKHTWAYPAYHYYDLNAGPGIDSAGRVGSPLKFMELAAAHDIPYRAFFFEKSKRTAKQLDSHVGNKARILIGDHQETFPQFYKMPGNGTVYGCIYADPSGKLPPFEMLGECSSFARFKRIDILIYLASANIKRTFKSPFCKQNYRIIDYIQMINKRFWIVREPQDKLQWTFLVGTNWTDFPAFEKIGFYRVESKQGQEILHKLSYTNEERKNGA